MQLLGNLFEYELARRGEELNILGATSGDTGSAAEYAMRGKHGVRVFMLSPHGRMSPFQQAQMFSLQDANIHNIAIDGVFDDCQDIVKAVSNDLAFKRKHTHRHGQLDQLGAPAGAGRLLLRRLLPGDEVERRAGQLRRAVGQLRQHLRRPRRAHDGPADPHAGASRPTRTTCSTSSSAPASTACAPAAETHETSSPSMDISQGLELRALRVRPARPRRRARRAQLFGDELGAQRRASTLSADRVRARRARFGFVSRPQHARRPPRDDPRHRQALRRR